MSEKRGANFYFYFSNVLIEKTINGYNKYTF